MNQSITEKTIKALKYAFDKHRNCIDKIGKPYIQHPVKVSELVNIDHLTEEEIESTMILAYLHDVVEDTDTTLQNIVEEFGINIANDLNLLTHKKGDTYRTYIETLSESKLASLVKIADIKHNTSIERYARLKGTDLEKFLTKIGSKYIPALVYLMSKWSYTNTIPFLVKWGE